MTKPRVLLADDHALVRDGMRTILEPDYEIVGEATDGLPRCRKMSEIGETLHISARTVERRRERRGIREHEA